MCVGGERGVGGGGGGISKCNLVFSQNQFLLMVTSDIKRF